MADLDIAALRKRMANYDAVHWPSISMPIEDVRALLDAAEERDRLRQTVRACVRDYNATRKADESKLGEGGLILAMAELLEAREERDVLLAAGERLIRATLMDTNSGAGIRKGWVEVRESQWDALFDERAPLVTLIRAAKGQP